VRRPHLSNFIPAPFFARSYRFLARTILCLGYSRECRVGCWNKRRLDGWLFGLGKMAELVEERRRWTATCMALRTSRLGRPCTRLDEIGAVLEMSVDLKGLAGTSGRYGASGALWKPEVCAIRPVAIAALSPAHAQYEGQVCGSSSLVAVASFCDGLEGRLWTRFPESEGCHRSRSEYSTLSKCRLLLTMRLYAWRVLASQGGRQRLAD